MADETCTLCHGTGTLSQKGIAVIYLLGRPVPGLLVLAGIVLSFFKGPKMLFLSVLGYILPLISADMRLSLYPVTVIGSLLGKKVNCPRCNPGGPVFLRNS